LFDSQTNNGEKELEEKKRKVVENKKKKQQETKEKTETIRKKQHRNLVAIKVTEESQLGSKVINF
jgi:sRNA-binding protein